MSPAAPREEREDPGRILPQPGVSWWSMAGRGLSPAPRLGAEDRAPHGCLGLTGCPCQEWGQEPRSCWLLGASCVPVFTGLVWESRAASCEWEPGDQVTRLGPL